MNAAAEYVLGNLRRARPLLRNVARAWILCRWANGGQSPTTKQIAERVGCSVNRAQMAIREVAKLGLMWPPRVAGSCWSGATPRAGLSLFDVLEALGPGMESITGRQCLELQAGRECERCGAMTDHEGRCGLCPILAKRSPGWLDRLRMYAERAEAGRPLFAEGV